MQENISGCFFERSVYAISGSRNTNKRTYFIQEMKPLYSPDR